MGLYNLDVFEFRNILGIGGQQYLHVIFRRQEFIKTNTYLKSKTLYAREFSAKKIWVYKVSHTNFTYNKFDQRLILT